MICFFYFYQKNLFFILGVANADPFFVQIWPKNSNFWTFYQFFSELLNINWIIINNINWIP